MNRKTPVYGLTGNIGCGKSTVGNFLAEFPDVAVIDADEVVKELLRAEENRAGLEALFGPEIFTDRQVDTKKLAKLVFNDRRLLLKLEDFTHPLVRQVILKRTRPRPGISFFVVEATLIYETGRQVFFDAIIAVTCPEAEQYRRLRQDRNMTDEDIDRRLARQLPAEEKARLADFVVNTDCSLEELKKRVRNLYQRLKKASEPPR